MNSISKVINIRNLQPVKPFFDLKKVTINDSYLSGLCTNENIGDIYTGTNYYFEFNNKFVEAYFLAFINHGNAVFSPSDLLFVFNTSFAKFVKEDPKVIEKYVKNHELLKDDNSTNILKLEKKKLEVFFSDNNPNKLDVVNMMLNKIKEEMYNPSIIKLLENNFSCATELEKTACNVSIMESVENFYKFSWMSYCGFNHIKLLGTRDDWSLLKYKVCMMQEYFMNNNEWNKYCQKFCAIIDEFIKCFDGYHNITFFEKMIDGDYSFGFYGDMATTCSGWILDLFYKFKYDYIIREVPNMVASIEASTDGTNSTLVAEFVGTSVTYCDDEYGNLSTSKKYLLSSDLTDHKLITHNSENENNDSENNDSDNENNNDDNNDDNNGENDNSFKSYAIKRVVDNKSDVIYDYRPVISCYFK